MTPKILSLSVLILLGGLSLSWGAAVSTDPTSTHEIDNRGSLLMRRQAYEIISNPASQESLRQEFEAENKREDRRLRLQRRYDYCKKWMYSSPEERQELIENIIEVRRILPSDPREALRGQRGAFARKPIKKDEVVGIYNGIILRERSIPGRGFLASTDTRVELEKLKGPSSRSYQSLNKPIEYYSVDFWSRDEGKDAEEGLLREQITMLSAYKRGNATSLINDPHGAGKEENLRLEAFSCQVANRLFMPVLFVVATEDIPEGEELLFNYGSNWEKSPDFAEITIDTSHLPPLTPEDFDVHDCLTGVWDKTPYYTYLRNQILAALETF